MVAQPARKSAAAERQMAEQSCMGLLFTGGEGEVELLAGRGGKAGGLREFAELFLPDRDSVVAGRDVLQFERTVGAGDGELGVVHHGKPGAHPGVDGALDADHRFLTGEFVDDVGGAGGHAFVPFAVVLGSGVDVVLDGITVANRERLARLHAEDARDEETALLVENDGLLRRFEFLAFEAGLDVDEDVGDGTIFAENNVAFGDGLTAAGLLAGRLLFHADDLDSGLGAFVSDAAAEGAGGTWIDAKISNRGCFFRRSFFRRGGGFVTSAAGEEQQACRKKNDGEPK